MTNACKTHGPLGVLHCICRDLEREAAQRQATDARIEDLKASLAASERRAAEMEQYLIDSEEWRKAYQKGKYALHEMGGEIQQAVWQHLPCNESGLDSRFTRLLEMPRLKAKDEEIADLEDRLAGETLRANDGEQRGRDMLDAATTIRHELVAVMRQRDAALARLEVAEGDVIAEGGRAAALQRGLAQSEEIRMKDEAKLRARLATAERERDEWKRIVDQNLDASEATVVELAAELAAARKELERANGGLDNRA